MAGTYKKFLKDGPDLAALGLARRAEDPGYFCTPRGAEILGWAGVDGIHYCTVRGFGEMVFAVSPMGVPGNYVRPVARNSEDFLRLLLACGGEAALEQARAWTQEQFDRFLRDNPPAAPQQRALDAIREQTGLAPMEAPFAYIKEVQSGFDASKIKYPRAFHDTCPNPQPAPPAWKVYFDGNFWGHSGRDRPGRELPMGREFSWAGRRWLVPAAYACACGLVVDVCMEVDPADIRAFLDRWNLSEGNDDMEAFSREDQMLLERENPLGFHFSASLLLNGRPLRSSHGCALCWNPCVSEGNDRESAQVLSHYGLDPARGWVIQRSAFPWATRRRPGIRTLSLTLEQQPLPVPGPHFRVAAAGDSFSFVHPSTGQTHTLTVEEYAPQQFSASAFGLPELEYPTHYTAMGCTVTPDLPAGSLTVQDCAGGDRPRRRQRDPLAPEAVSDAFCIGVIGGADGPTAIVLGPGGGRTPLAACSSLHFEPAEDVEWRMVFHEKQYPSLTAALLP